MWKFWIQNIFGYIIDYFGWKIFKFKFQIIIFIRVSLYLAFYTLFIFANI